MPNFCFHTAQRSGNAVAATFLALSFALVPQAHAAPAPTATATSAPPTVTVKGDIARSNSWTRPQLERLGALQTIHTTLKGQPYTARGVRLWDVVRTCALRLDPKIKHDEARFVVLARGRDGYTATFAWPELMPQIGNKSAFLIWEANGQPLPAKEGAFRLIVPGDQKPMRWVYDLTSLEIYNGQRLSAAR